MLDKLKSGGLMTNYVQKANLNILNGILLGSMEFKAGLNIISGENGTLKTRLLQSLKQGAAIAADINMPLNIQAISPKRNSERRQAQAIIQMFRQQNRTLDTHLNERLNTQINDQVFENYPSIGDLYYLVFEHQCRDGGDRKEHMGTVTDEFNDVIHSIFECHSLVSVWNTEMGAPNITIRKSPNIEFPIESLSLGQQEILSLATNIYTSKDRFDVFLIDEPEVHLNWHLEEKLFDFLDLICEKYDKQVIVVTHSRTIFKPRFIERTQFLYWSEEGHVHWGQQLTPEQKKKLAGDAIDVIRLGDFSKPTFFVEDSAHKEILDNLAKVLGVEIGTTECGKSSNVKILYKHSLREGGWQNCFFLVDGDNQGNSFKEDPKFIHLPAYCLENYLLSPDLVAVVANKSEDEVRELIVQAIKAQRAEILKNNKFLDFLLDGLTPNDISFERLLYLDASLILESVLLSLGLNRKEYINDYLNRLNDSGRLDEFFPSLLLKAMRSFLPETEGLVG
jgi:predicted ATPase